MKALILALSLLATPAAAEMTCLKRADMVQTLKDQYQEKRYSAGTIGEQLFAEMYGNEEEGTWTLTYTNLEGITCIIAAGNNFQVETYTSTPGAPA